MSERLAVLDEHGMPTGANIERAEAHKKGFWHGTVHVYVYRVLIDGIQILVHLRANNKDQFPNAWDTVLGGHIQATHTPIATVIYELRDEIGIDVSLSELIVGPVLKSDRGLNKEFNHIFAYPLPPCAVLYFRDAEVQEVQWMRPDGIFLSIQSSPQLWRPTCSEFSIGLNFLASLPR